MRPWLLFPLALSLASCSVQAKMVLTPQGPVNVTAQVALQPQALNAWKGLRDLDPTLPPDPLAPDLLEKGLGDGAQVTTSGGVTTLAFVLPAPKKVLPGLKTAADLWDVTLDRAAVRRLLALTAWGKSPVLDSLLPPPGTKITEAEYRDLLAYLIGPALSDSQARALVDASTVELTIEAPRPVKAAALATSISGNTALYRWPLVKVLTLDPPIRLRVLY